MRPGLFARLKQVFLLILVFFLLCSFFLFFLFFLFFSFHFFSCFLLVLFSSVPLVVLLGMGKKSNENPASSTSSGSTTSCSSSSSSSSSQSQPAPDSRLAEWLALDVNPTCADKLVAQDIRPETSAWLSSEEIDELNLMLGTKLVIRSLKSKSFGSSSQVVSTSGTNLAHLSASAQARAHMPKLPYFNSDVPSTSSRAFIKQFEIKLRAADYPLRLYSTALASVITGTGLSWAVATLPEKDWTTAKNLFFTHFEKPNYLEAARAQLFNLRQGKNQSVTSFADTFLELMDVLQKSIEDPDALYQFRVGLSSDLQKSYISASAARPITNINDAIDLALLLETAIANPVTTTTSPAATQSYDRKDSGSRKGKKYCTLHGNGGHTTADCRALKKGKVSSSPSSPTSLQSTASTSSSKSPKSSPSPSQDFSSVTCYKCGKLGHYANKCTSTTLAFLEGLPEEPVELLPFEVSFENLDNNENLPFSFPLNLNNTIVTAHLDTGASSSFLSSTTAEKVGAVRQSLDTTILLGHQSSSVKSSEIASATVNQLFSHKFLVLDIRHDCIVGRDLMGLLAIGITNLPHPIPPSSMPPPIPDSPPSLFEESFFSDQDELKRYMHSIQPLLDKNAAILPNSVCSIPNSEVHLPVPIEKAKFVRQYRIPEVFKPMVDMQVQKWKSKGVVVSAPPGCKFNNPLTTAPKKDPVTGQVDSKTRRICLDPRAFNPLLPDDHFSLPLIEDIFAALKGAVIFSSLDIEDAYPRLSIYPPDRPVTAFMHRGEHLMFARAIYGIKHMSSHFQRIVTSALQPFNSFCLVFVDDIIIFSKTPEDHVKHLCAVIECLTASNLPLKLVKCHFFMKRLYLLGHLISYDEITIDHRKLTNINKWKPPSSAKEVAKFLGFVNYFRKFIPNYALIAAPLEQVRKTFSWSTEQQSAWETFKTVLLHAPALSLPDFSLPFEVYTDASNSGLGAVLLQRPSKDRVAYVGFVGRALQPAEVNYSATKKELLAVMFALTRWRHFLLGHNFTLFTDHRALTALFTSEKLTVMSSNWLDIILEFSNFKIVHFPGVSNVLPDYISRVFHKGGNDASSSSPSPDSSLSSAAELFSIQTVDRLLRTEAPPEDRKSLLDSAHSLGHFGATAIVKHIWCKGITWPNIRKDAVEFVSSCRACQRFNFVKTGFHPLTPLKAEYPLDHICIDLAGPLPTSPQGNNYVLVAVDVCSRFIFLRAISSKTAQCVAAAILSICADFGFPRIISSDNGREFVNSIIKSFSKVAGFATRTTSAYHPRANGLAERFVQTAVRTVKKVLLGDLANWDQYVPMTQFFINNKVSEHHQSTPFAVMFARSANSLSDHSDVSSGSLTPAQIKDRILFVTDTVFPAIHQSASETQSKMSDKFNSSNKTITFDVGSMVMYMDTTKKSKLDPTWLGPCRILKCTKGGAYVLLDNDGQLLDRRFPPSHLKLVSPPEDDKISFVVGKILNHRGSGDKIEYFVSWDGYDKSYDSWVPASDFNDFDMISEYQKSLKPSSVPKRKASKLKSRNSAP